MKFSTLQVALLGAIQLSFLISVGNGLKPVRVGTFDTMLDPGTVSGEVYLVDHSQIFIRNLVFDVPSSVIGDNAFFCGVDSSSPDFIVIPHTIDKQRGSISYFRNSIITDGLELSFPPSSSKTVTDLQWFGICSLHYPDYYDDDYYYYNYYDEPETRVITRIDILPSLVSQVPCEATFLGEFSGSSHGVEGRVYLLNRITFAILGFSYDGTEPDVFFWVGAGETPSITGYPCTYEDNVITYLPAMDSQSLEVQVPRQAQGTVIDYFAVWCRGNNEALGSVPLPSGLITTPSPPPPEGQVLLGSLLSRAHNVQGTVYALDNKTILIDHFYFDGNAPATRFLAVRGTFVSTTYNKNQFWYLPDETGSNGSLVAYFDRSITITLPDDLTVHDFNFFSVWCQQFRQNFGEVELPEEILLDGTVIVPTLPPIPDCQPVLPSNPINCKQLSDDLTMSWTVDETNEAIRIELCGCVQPDNYMAFGLSGSSSGVQMFGADVTWTWLDNAGVHAGDLYLTGYAQCVISEADGVVTRQGACPDAEADVFDVTGYRENCRTCIAYSRPLNSADPNDKKFLLDEEQYVVWAVGPVGSIDTAPLGTVAVPFKHYSRADRTDTLKINFNRSPLDECSLQCTSCDVALEPWVQPELEHTTAINARIGHSGGERGYAAITGTAGWGISWYLNGLLIPNVTVYRGTTYTFTIEGGNDPSNQARYHPFYITSSSSGGYLAKSELEKKSETVYAGFDGNNPLGLGRFCKYTSDRDDRADEFSSFEQYKPTLELECLPGEPGSFTWTPDESTPDIVYYQCATHQYLGWKIHVQDALPPLTLHFVQDSPRISGKTLELFFTLSRPAESVSCQITRNRVKTIKDCSSGHVTFSDLLPGDQYLRVDARNSREDRFVERRTINVPNDDRSCSVHLINDGVEVEGGSAKVEFAAVGSRATGFVCTLDQESTPCSSPLTLDSLSAGDHRLRVVTTGCLTNNRLVTTFTV